MGARFFARGTHKEVSTPVQWEEPILKHEFEGHEENIWGLVFLPDDIHIVTGSRDGTMRKWNCDTGLVVGEPWKGEGGKIFALALSPDGKIIACGRVDGSVQQWNTEGEIIKDVWMGHSKAVWSLSWSPIGNQIASGSKDGTILIRSAESGKVMVGPIKTKRQYWVCALAYSPSGDRIASGESSTYTICIWNAKTGKLVIRPIKGLGNSVTSIHKDSLWSIALSPKHNILACGGMNGVVQLWDIESHQPLGKLFHQDHENLFCVLFSRDGRHLACSGKDGKLALWMLAPQLSALTPPQQINGQSTQEETRPNSPSLSCPDADATGGNGFVEEARDDPYHDFFQSSQQSIPSPSPGFRPPPLFLARRLWNVISRRRPPPDESVPKENTPSMVSSVVVFAQTLPDGKMGGKDGTGEQDDNCVYDPLDLRKDKGEKRDEPPADAQSLPSDDPTNLDSKDNQNLWKRMVHAGGKDSPNTKISAAIKRPEVVEVSAVRGFQGHVAFTPENKKKSLPCSAPLVVPHTGGSSAAGPPSQVGSAQPGTSSQLVSVQAGPSSRIVVGAQVTGGPSTHASPSHFVTTYRTNHDSDSRSSIEGSCNRLLDRICFPRGHYH
ncbi:WD40-repeat-containing domain protein [Suillus placidus]|uniref:WD40-repeat-containing domain protein n=1 Tax=Suillus placidus TaxID=48579 RepID=A0A9P7A1B9_9AGAM|nr:WD40-repeat-containing domain protein [Suillus placidus]